MKTLLILILSVSCSHFSAADVCKLDVPFNFKNGDKLSLTTITGGFHLGRSGAIYFNNNPGLGLAWQVYKRSTLVSTSLVHGGHFETRTSLSTLSHLSISFKYEREDNNLTISLSTETGTFAGYVGLSVPKVRNLLVFNVTWENVPFTYEIARTTPLPSTTASSRTEKQEKGVDWMVVAVAGGAAGGPLLILSVILAVLLYKSRRSMPSNLLEHEEEAVSDSIATPSTVGDEEEYHIYENERIYANIGLNRLPQIHGHQLALPQ